jgi:DNA uptake protein ComE-like DNA-binding protein
MTPEPPPPLDDARLACALAATLLLGATAAHAVRVDVATPALERHLVNVNAAPPGEIEALPGVGRVLAERIVAERRGAPFVDADDLGRVPGIGATTVSRVRPFVRCGGR